MKAVNYFILCLFLFLSQSQSDAHDDEGYDFLIKQCMVALDPLGNTTTVEKKKKLFMCECYANKLDRMAEPENEMSDEELLLYWTRITSETMHYCVQHTKR